ncbi:MAG: SRPBCC domain-containing protein [Phycisphaeraceae bacterium]|nr:SRPBCC domain-containing protein [Phycisphaeraceae bacterium]
MKQATQNARFKKSFAISDSPERVFRALTAPDELRSWFAEHAEVEPKAGGVYGFWGTLTPWTPRECATQRIIRIDPPRLLSYSWRWRELDSTVIITLDGSSKHTNLRIVQEGTGKVLDSRENTEFAMLDFWRLSIGNLRSFLKNGKAALRPNFENKGDRVALSIEIEAPAAAVFRALTDPAQMDKWISTKAAVEPRAGGTYNYGWKFGDPPAHCGPHRFLAIEPGKMIEHDWDHAKEPTSRVRWEISEIGPGRSRVTLTHLRPAEDDSTRGGYIAGWGAFMHMLKQFGENPEATDLR